MFHLRKNNVLAIIVISSLLFAVIHIPMKGIDPFKMIGWFLGGITYAYMYMKSGNLVVPTLAHAIHNFTGDFMIYSHLGFSLFELSSDIGDDMKLLFKVPLALVLILLTILFYGKNGLLTPAPSINKLWGVRS
jgi:membrane protease YdiL (CAAX protease family)